WQTARPAAAAAAASRRRWWPGASPRTGPSAPTGAGCRSCARPAPVRTCARSRASSTRGGGRA
ncbi:MAG: hypothetical protein AVDCRST_MAG20-2777, partial [uncultured Acidimicrobiales bacterium]